MRTPISLFAGLVSATAFNLGAQAVTQNSVSPAPPSVSSATSEPPADCDYNTCALRMKLSWGNWRIIRGEQEQRVATIGMFRAPNIESLVATSPEAVQEVHTFRSNYTSGEILQAVGAVLMGVGLAAHSANDEAVVIPITAVLGGGATLLYGVHRHVRAFNSLHKTIWLYNRSLKR